ncbi:MAG: ABC transporter substrate-binding protein [Fusobacterium sp. JB021]|nr:ABC transporter substrate-binding protein [Fusobacterium sp. JB021]MDP0507254.1 ABC transporter substrate-binding protein [Fusobacterium sp. JB019]
MKKKLVALFMSLFLLGACGSEKGNENKPINSNKVVVRITQDPDFLDPHKAVAAATGEILFNVFEGLIKIDANGDLYPALAESYKVSNDHLTYTFKIRKGVQFQNGIELTPELVKKSYDRFLDDNFPANRVATEFKKISKSIEVKNDNVIFTLKKVNGSGLAAFIVGVVYDDGHKIYGTGPYFIDEYLPGEKVTVKKFNNYWNINQVGNAEIVDFKIIKDNQSAIMAFQMGEVNIIHRLFSGYEDMIGENGKLIKGEQNLVQLLAINNKVEPLNNLKVRQAIQYAIDKQEIIEGASLGEGSIVGSACSPVVKSIYNKNTEHLYSHNIEKARELLKEAGYPNGFELTLKAPSNYQVHVDSSQIIKEQLAKIGIIVNIQEIEWGTWLSNVYKNRNYQLTVIGFEGKPSPYTIFSRYMSKDKRNMVNFSNEKYDEILNKISMENNENEKVILFKEAQNILTKNVASVFLQAPNYIVAINKNIDGFKIYPCYVLDLSLLNIRK